MSDSFQNLFEDDFLGNLESKKDTVKLKDGERRIVSILFLDVSGFTKLSNTIDHEEVRDLIDKLFQVFTASIEKNGGYIDKYEGDAIMALFGAKVASEVDTHRAITTGLEIIDKLKKFNEYLIKDPKYPITEDQRLSVRIGINSGKVTTGLVGKGREGDFTVFGPAVNLAARMESSAPLNEVMVPKSVKSIVDDHFNFKDQKSIEVKGFDEKIETYLVDSKKDIQDKSQSKTPYIGNQKSVLQLSKIYQSSLDAMSSQKANPVCVGIQADAGMGKSRLVNEFLNNMNEGIKTTHYIRSGADNITVKPYHILIRIIKKALSIFEGDSIEDISHKMNNGIAKLSSNLEGDLLKRSERINDRIGFLLGLNEYRSLASQFSGQDLKNEINQSLRIFIEILSFNANLSGVPLILIFEDLHWADQGSLESLSYIVNTLNLDQRRQKDSEHHCFFVFDYREDFSLPKMILNVKDFSTINLEPLNATDCHEMSKHFIEELIIPDEVVDTLLEYSKGNPFFIEEWLKSLEGNIKWSHEDIKGWTSSIPDSLNSLIISRIDQLKKTDKQVLQNASVIGKKFYYDTLETLEQKLDESSNIREPINQLVKQSFLMNEHLKKDLYLFKNILTQQVSYKSVLRSNRKLLHGLIADILENSYKDRKEEFIEDLSHHYYLSEENAKAKEYLVLAIKKVKKLHALNLAKDYYQKLIDVYTHEHAQLSHVLEGDKIDNIDSNLLDFFNILHDYSAILMKTGEGDQSDQYLSIIESHIKDDKEFLEFYGKICFSKGNSFFLRGDLDSAEKEFKKHLKVAKQFKSIENEWTGRLHLSRIEYSRGKYDEAEKELTELIQLHKKIDNSIYSLGEIYNDLGILSFHKGEFENSLKYFSKLERLCTERNENVLAAQALGNMGTINNAIGNYDEAYNAFKKVLKTNEDIGDYRILSRAHGNLGISLKGLKKYDEALQEYDFQIEISNRSGDQEGVGRAFSNKCNIYRKLGDYDEAVACSKKACDIYSNMDAKLNMGISLGNLGDAYFEKGDFKDSEKNLKESLQIFRDTNSKANECEVLYYLAKNYFYNDEKAQAINSLNDAIKICEDQKDMNMLSKSYFLLSKALLSDNNTKESYDAIKEAADASEKIKNKFLKQDINLFKEYLKSHIDKDFSLDQLDNLNKDFDDKNAAVFYFLRWKISKSEIDRKESISKFSNLYKSKPSFSYLYYLNLLKK